MATYKPVDVDQLDADLTAVADAIRLKAGTEGAMSFPEGFINTIDSIETNTSPIPDNAGIYYIGNTESTMGELIFDNSATGELTQ